MKRLADLAILGGPPLFACPLHVGRPSVPEREHFLRRVDGILDRLWFTNDGPCVRELETRIAELIGVRHCVAMCNGTVALEIAIRAVGLTGEVIVPSLTFVATAHALQWQQITPVFCDVDPRTYNLDPARLEALITPRTSGIIGVHLWGRPCAVDVLAEIAARRRLRLLYDAAHAFGCSVRGRMIGGFGEAEVLSFHATKFFNTLEGGAVLTNDDELAQKMRLMRNFGFDGYDNVIYIGTNGKMNEISAAMGCALLDSLDEIIAVNRRNYHAYRRALAATPHVTLMAYDEGERCNYQYIVLEMDEAAAGVSRDELVAVLWAENVLARRYFYPGCHRMEPYRSHFPHAGLLLPETDRIGRCVVTLPTGSGVTPEDIAEIVALIHLVLTHGEEVHTVLSGGLRPSQASAGVR